MEVILSGIKEDPSDFFKVEKESSLDSLKKNCHSSKPEKD